MENHLLQCDFDTWWRGAIARYPELHLAGPSDPPPAEPSSWPGDFAVAPSEPAQPPPPPSYFEPVAPIDFLAPEIPVARVPMNVVPSRHAPRPRRVRRIARRAVCACGVLLAAVLIASVATAQSARGSVQAGDSQNADSNVPGWVVAGATIRR